MMEFTFLLDKVRSWLPLLPLLLLLAATYWLNQQVQPLPQIQIQQRHDLDYEVDNFNAITLNTQGQPRFTLSAEKLWHYPDDDTTHLQRPDLSALSAERPPTLTSAKTGMISSKGDDVFLYDDVNITRPSNNGIGIQRFTTDYLHAIPDRDWAETDHAVVMTDQYNIIHAIGMELDNKARFVRLLSRVSANHEQIRH